MNRATSVSEAVANGAQLLDEKHPGWYKKINLGHLHVGNCSDCVCGQLSGTHEGWDDFALSRLGIDLHDAGNFGFAHYIGEERKRRDGRVWHETVYLGWSYKELTAEWKQVIQTRLDLDKLPAPVEEQKGVTV